MLSTLNEYHKNDTLKSMIEQQIISSDKIRASRTNLRMDDN